MKTPLQGPSGWGLAEEEPREQAGLCGQIAYEPLDNGIRSCSEVTRVQHIAAGLDAAKIETVFRKWLSRLPHPFTGAQRKAGYRYQLSILQAEFPLTQVLDRPLTGRCFFDEVIRENLDVGRPDQI